MTSATPSNYESVANALASRGFRWKSVKMDDVRSNSINISFEEEWHQFASLIANTADGVRHKQPPPAAEDVWTNHFKGVITNLQESELSFSSALFNALRDSLTAFVHRIDSCGNDRNVILLQSTGSSSVGFGKGVYRKKLGFKEGYALSQDSESDHGCFVFGTKKRQSSGTDETDDIYDMTAVVELKSDQRSCKSFSAHEESGEIKPPNFRRDHGPMGQAMVYSMDVWHCLARRGVSVQSVSVVVLAGKTKSEDTERICCLEAHIRIPEYCGEEFLYTVDRFVHFNEATVITTDEAVNIDTIAVPINRWDERALAIYIKTMRIGLELAVEVCRSRSESNPMVPPVSLCCRQLLRTSISAQLVASPIPKANPFQDSVMKVNQGELFKLTKPTKEIFSGFPKIHWFVGAEGDDILTNDCLVKVSCLSVHNTYINHYICERALYTLYIACEKNAELKLELSKVLLGYCHIGSSVSLISIMKDLQAGEEKFQVLNHQKFRRDGKLPQLWLAFCVLVKSLLLPMVDADVVHLDIRSTVEFTYNILVSDAIELRLIDFDSIVLCGSSSGCEQKDAIYWEDLKETVRTGVDWKSAYRYLFWQVLWIAYTWHPPSPDMTQDSLPKERNAYNFVRFLFADNYFVEFKKWLGSGVGKLKSMADETITAETIRNALVVFESAFCGKSLQE
jgi:hypothetical protein